MIKVNFGNSLTFWRGLRFCLLLVVPFLILLKVIRRPTKMTIINKSGREVYFLLLEAGFSLSMARMLTAQAAHETGNFESAIFKENNNLFGMKLPAVRKTTAIGQNKGHAIYKTISDSIQDIQIYRNNYKYLSDYSSLEIYVKALKRNNYFEASETEYLNGCTHFYNLYFNGK